MLVLSRKLGQRVQIGSEIQVTVVRVDRQTVRIGIDAPNGTLILREELLPVEASIDPEQWETRFPINQPNDLTNTWSDCFEEV